MECFTFSLFLVLYSLWLSNNCKYADLIKLLRFFEFLHKRKSLPFIFLPSQNRRAPPGKCKIKPAPVKIKGKLIHFYPKEGKGNMPLIIFTTTQTLTELNLLISFNDLMYYLYLPLIWFFLCLQSL